MKSTTPPLYKYNLKKYVKRMLDGYFYINTLENLREEEKHGSAIGDKEEGVKTINATTSFKSGGDSIENIPPFVKDFIGGLDKKGMIFKNCSFRKKYIFPNVYIYSTSKIYNQSIEKDFGYDACIKINNPNLFFKEITNTLIQEGYTNKNFCSGECVYGEERINDYRNVSNTHQILIKPKKYSYQQEVRMVWFPKETSIEIQPMEIFCEKALTHIEEIK